MQDLDAIFAPSWMEALSHGEAHIWIAYPTTISPDDMALLSTYDQWMSEDERARHQRFMFAKHRHDFLITRALIRTTLSRYFPIAPEEWDFVHNEHGRPEIAPGLPGAASLRFNISHTDGVIACLLNLSCDAGLDVEHDKRVKEPLQLAEHFFSPREVRSLRALPTAEAQRARFFAYWTLKEALIKAKGMGLALPLHQFSFLLDQDSLIDIAFDDALAEEPPLWQFLQWQLSPHHKMAAAVRHPTPEGALKIRCYEVMPLRDAPTEVSFPLLARSFD